MKKYVIKKCYSSVTKGIRFAAYEVTNIGDFYVSGTSCESMEECEGTLRDSIRLEVPCVVKELEL